MLRFVVGHRPSSRFFSHSFPSSSFDRVPAKRPTFRYFSSRSMSYIGAIDQGTSSTRFVLYDSNGKLVSSHQTEFDSIEPKKGYVEHDPLVLLNTTNECIEKVVTNLEDDVKSNIKAVGIANQRETTIAWDKKTGKPLYNGIVWLDTRTVGVCEDLLAKKQNDSNAFRASTGLPIHSYFSATKILWLLSHSTAVKEAVKANRCCFGTVDSWLIWNLSGGAEGGVHVTDVTNASRTMLMNLTSKNWDPEICSELGIPIETLPSIKSSSEIYGTISHGPLAGIPIAGALGDQQAALVGQKCFEGGTGKSTYGTGCFMLYNTGKEPTPSTHGLLTTVAYQLGPKAPTHYALEGSIAIGGAGVKWLRDNLGLIAKASDLDPLASSVPDTADVYFVPAFSGLYAPYWRPDARGHLARAVIEAVCFQTDEVLEAMEKDSKMKMSRLLVDGGMTQSSLTLQTQADLLGIPVVKPLNAETTSLGAAFAAGLAVGVWKDLSSLPSPEVSEFTSSIGGEERISRINRWKEAVQRSLNWAKPDRD